MGLALIIIMVCAACLTLSYYGLLSRGFLREKKNLISSFSQEQYPHVSVIIASKNSGNQIYHLVQKILKQDYPIFEVMVIDDFSTDNSVEKLGTTLRDDNLVLLKAKYDTPGKKTALSQAIASSKYSVLLFTDADCMPTSDEWIKKMVQTLMTSVDKEVVLGYGPMIAQSNVISRFARYETFLTAFQYIGYADLGLPYMGVGRNLMYKKSVFESAGGFSGHHHIASGDDDLFVQSIVTGSNVAVCTDPDTFMYSEGKNNIKDFLMQKGRHVSTSLHYRPILQLLLGIFSAAHLLFYSSLIIVFLFYHQWIIIALAIFLFKLAGQIFLSHKVMKRLVVADLLVWTPFLDFLLFGYYLLVSVFGLLRKNKW
ncbi:MAG: glycosyltransferase [Saprospiraceae bacterium]|nr:glycosyltransferase [Saprospiraceae bacterium]